MKVKKKKEKNPSMACHYPNPWEAGAVGLLQFKTSLGYYIHSESQEQYKILSNK